MQETGTALTDPKAAPSHTERPRRMRFAATALFIYLVLLAGYVLSFVHRTAPAAIADELTRAFHVNGAVLGTLAATYFYVYTVLQVPVGVLADTIGPRIIVTAGAVVAAAGSILFGLAPGWELAAVGRVLVGIGVAVTFVALLKVCANWFPPQRFASLNGITLLAGNLGAAAAGAPLVWLVTVASWRSVFVGLGLASLALAVLTWIVVRDKPQECGFKVSYAPPQATAVHWAPALRAVLTNPASWPAFFVNIGVAGSFFAFAGLWVVPYLHEGRGLPQAVASNHASLLVLGVALGSLVVGLLSDRLRSRVGLMRLFAVLYALSWLPLVFRLELPLALSYAWFFVMGLFVPAFVLTWTVAKEMNRPEHAGMAVSLVNTGIFLGAGILQPLVGALLDAARPTLGPTAAWDRAIWLFASTAAAGAVCTLFVKHRFSGPAISGSPSVSRRPNAQNTRSKIYSLIP